jgi:hypothetical protein
VTFGLCIPIKSAGLMAKVLARLKSPSCFSAFQASLISNPFLSFIVFDI